jgi:hypothetical protein
MKGRRLGVILAAAAAVAIVVFEVVLFVRHGSADGTANAATRTAATRTSAAKKESTTKAGAVPLQAAAAVQLLMATEGRTALTPELNASLPPGRMFPAGTTFTVKQGTWHQAGAYANVSGTLQMPGHAPELAEIGLVHRNGRWLITFEAAQ